MPIVNGAYVAPTWNNDAPPAINAAELQDICDTIETYNTSKADVSYVNTFVRPNLLDNAYFVGGGSQQGGGQFPINHRGSAVYSPGAGQYTIDRWYYRIRTGCSLTIEANDLMLTSGGAGFQGIVQSVENGVATLAGKTVTLSVLVTQNNLSSAQFTLSNSSSSITVGTEISHTTVTGTGIFSFTATVPSSLSNNYLNVVLSFSSDAANKTIKIAAMKLEVGDTQTLAHQENGVWVLNEIPNYEAELARCQRYCLVADWNTGKYTVMYGATTGTGTAQITIPTPVTMRTTPTFSSTPKITIYCNGSEYNTTNYSPWTTSEGSITFKVNALDSGSFPGTAYPIRGVFNSGTLCVISADL